MRPRDWTAWRGHVRTSHCWKRRESPQLLRALAAGLQSPEGHTEPGPAPWTAGDHCSQSIQTRHATPPPGPAAAQVTRPPGTATPKSGEDGSEGAGEEAVPRFRPQSGSIYTGTEGWRDREREETTEAGGRRREKNGKDSLRLGEETGCPAGDHPLPGRDVPAFG